MTTAIILAGAGARGAYEAGVLSVLLPELRKKEDQILLVGTSAGAINTALVAATAHRTPQQSAETLREVWCTLTDERVFNLSWPQYLQLGLGFLSANRLRFPTHSLLDTSPLFETIDRNPQVDWARLGANIGKTWVKAAGVVATEVESGVNVVFAHGLDPLPKRDRDRRIEYRAVQLTGEHVRASAAIPIAFPAVHVKGHGWFADGGIRLNTPIAPGLAFLGDREPKRVIVIATHPDPNAGAARRAKGSEQPDIIDEGASILHSILVDRVAEDIRSLRRVNRAIGGLNATRVRNPKRPDEHLEVIPHIYFGPPGHGLFAEAAREVFAAHYARWSTHKFSLLSRALGGEGASRDELLSYLLFDPRYLTRIFELGRENAGEQLEDGLDWVTDPDESG